MIGFALLCVFVNILSVNAQIDTRNLLQYLEDGNFTTLVKFIKRAGLAGAFSTGGPFTIFAPTDEAFRKLPQDALNHISGDPDGLLDFLRFHVANGIVISQMLTNGSQFQMLNNKSIHIMTYPNNATTANGVSVGSQNVIVRNGVVHKVDSVLLPMEKSISEYLGEHDSQFQDLYASLVLEGLEKTLESGNFTIFAPGDQAFTNIVSALPNITTDDKIFQRILKMHVVPGVYFSAGLTDGMKLQSLAGYPLTVSVDSTGVFINGAKVLYADVAATNGVVHTLEEVLIVPHT